uniref:MADF domain-containing protein n=1 Tax=Strongyloides venezuelensis TaxID=75913 RepID=A0A0K0F6J9_STRVS
MINIYDDKYCLLTNNERRIWSILNREAASEANRLVEKELPIILNEYPTITLSKINSILKPYEIEYKNTSENLKQYESFCYESTFQLSINQEQIRQNGPDCTLNSTISTTNNSLKIYLFLEILRIYKIKLRELLKESYNIENEFEDRTYSNKYNKNSSPTCKNKRTPSFIDRVKNLCKIKINN